MLSRLLAILTFIIIATNTTLIFFINDVETIRGFALSSGFIGVVGSICMWVAESTQRLASEALDQSIKLDKEFIKMLEDAIENRPAEEPKK